MWASLAAACAVLWACGAPAAAGPVLDRVRAEGAIHCGAVARPGLLDFHQGQASGLFADLCRAVGVATLGPAARVELRSYDSDLAFEAARNGADEVAFLSGADIVGQRLADVILPGPTVFVLSTAVMVPASSTAHDLVDLAGEPVCFEQGTPAHRGLEAWFATRALSFMRMGYQEPDEMTDAYDSGVCHAIVGEATTLAALRAGPGVPRDGARLLPTPLTVSPIVAATSLTDGQWSALVAFTIQTLRAADRAAGPWQPSGLAALPLTSLANLSPAWQQTTIATVGSYSAMIDRNLGAGSSLRLVPGTDVPIEGLTPALSDD